MGEPKEGQTQDHPNSPFSVRETLGMGNIPFSRDSEALTAFRATIKRAVLCEDSLLEVLVDYRPPGNGQKSLFFPALDEPETLALLQAFKEIEGKTVLLVGRLYVEDKTKMVFSELVQLFAGPDLLEKLHGILKVSHDQKSAEHVSSVPSHVVRVPTELPGIEGVEERARTIHEAIFRKDVTHLDVNGTLIPVRIFRGGTNGLRGFDIPTADGKSRIRFVEQNPNKDTWCGKAARTGDKITWAIDGQTYMAHVRTFAGTSRTEFVWSKGIREQLMPAYRIHQSSSSAVKSAQAGGGDLGEDYEEKPNLDDPAVAVREAMLSRATGSSS